MEKKQFSIAVGVLTNEEGKILIASRHQPEFPDVHGKLEFPGGGIEFGEKPEEAVIREVKEETGLDVEIIKLLPKVETNVWKRPEAEFQVFILAFHCRVIGGEISTADPEIGSLKFMNASEITDENSLPKTKSIIELLNS